MSKRSVMNSMQWLMRVSFMLTCTTGNASQTNSRSMVMPSMIMSRVLV